MSGSLSSVANFRDDAFAVAAKIPFVPENIVIGKYTFLPWVRTGLISGVQSAAANQVRAAVTVSIDVEDDAGSAPIAVKKTLTVRGPGDVLRFETSQIVRRYPNPGTPNAEDTYFAHIEFDRPDFPWLFSPFGPLADRVPPWLALVVLEQSHAFITTGAPGRVPVVHTRLGELQSLDNSWAWAHAQILGSTTDPGPSVADRLTDEYGAANLSRLLCPRTLSPNKGYVACLVPAFDVGVRVQLGQSGGTLGPAWKRAPGDDDQEIVLPVFDRWSFATASDGDFESLAKKLDGVPAPWNVGRRTIDASNPGGDIVALGAGDPGRIQVIRCALTAPSTAPKPEGAPDDTASWNAAKMQELESLLNLPAKLGGDSAAGPPPDLPIIGPRIYARYQRGQSTVDALPPGDWFNELNLEPTNRVVAGLGTRVVQKDREDLMQAAWAQVGSIEATNRNIARAQMARFVGASLHSRHFSALGVGDLAQVTRGVHAKVKLGSAVTTILGTAAKSAAAPAALTVAFRRATRTRGPLARYIDAGGRVAMQRLVAAGTQFRDFRRAYVEPDGIVTLSANAIAGISAETAAKVLGVPQPVAIAELSKRATRLAAIPSAADQLLTDPATWKPTQATFDIGAFGAKRALDAVRVFMPTNFVAQPSRAESLATLLTGLSISHTPVAASASESVRHIDARLPASIVGRPLAPRPLGIPVVVEAHTEIGLARARFESIASRQMGLTLATTRAVSAAELTSALSQFARGTGILDLPRTPARAPLVVARDALLGVLHPRVTVTARVKARITTRPTWLPPDWFDNGLVQPIMAAPTFTRPMYEALDDYDRDWLVPGLSKIPLPDFVTVLETNPTFTESFLAGLSDQMGRELLFRGYPTDQRGTYFRRFWTENADDLGQELHRFARTPLGTHLSASAGGATGRLVFVVRGELIRRYPDAIPLALRAGGLDPVTGHPIFIDPATDKTAVARILFIAPLPPDILLVGFDLTEADLQPNRWWFLIAEHPTAPRFGVEKDANVAIGAHAGLVAHAFFREPVRAAFEASKLVAKTKGGV